MRVLPTGCAALHSGSYERFKNLVAQSVGAKSRDGIKSALNITTAEKRWRVSTSAGVTGSNSAMVISISSQRRRRFLPPLNRVGLHADGSMRKIIVLTFLTLDGVMQAPGGPEEDPTGGFAAGGWVVPYFDDFLGQTMGEQMSRPFDLLLGRKTFEIFASYWPAQESPINEATKYVASKTLTEHEWKKSVFLRGEVVAEVKKLKGQDGPELQVHGSGNFIQTLLAHDLVDELWLKIFPITLGRGKRLFAEGTSPAAFTMREAKTSPRGVIVASYDRAGDVQTGSFA
jgi:dihydrofolate reductase